MNIYSTRFFARCPVNGVRIEYTLTIETHAVIRVEKIIDYVQNSREGFHEDFADEFIAVFGGKQTLVAEHHGVTITTIRKPT